MNSVTEEKKIHSSKQIVLPYKNLYKGSYKGNYISKPFYKKTNSFFKKKRKKNFFFIFRKKLFKKIKHKKKKFKINKKKDKLFKKWIQRKIAKLVLKRYLKKFKTAKLYLYASNHNTIITAVGRENNTLFRVSAGSVKKGTFKKGLRKKSFPSYSVGDEAAKKLKTLKINAVVLFLNGSKRNRKNAMKALDKNKIIIKAIKDITPIAHNGCRAKKRRRL